MAGYWLESGMADATQIMLGRGDTPTFFLGLYVNNHTPVWSDDTGTFIECKRAGYSEVSIPYANWGTDLSGSSPLVNTALPCTFSGTNRGSPGQVLYGYFLINTTSGLIWYAELFGSAYTLPAAAWFYVVVPSFTMGQCGAC